MQVNLNEEFYKGIRRDFEKYAKDYDRAMERSAYFQDLDQERVVQVEQDYETLDKFGAII